MVNPGDDDATASPPTSGIVNTPSVLPEPEFAPNEWEDTLQCVKEVYSAFDVKIVDTKPTTGIPFSMIMVGGNDTNRGATALGLSAGIGGIALVSGNCQPFQRGVSYAFADVYGGSGRAIELCWTIAQETAHSFGLDHEFSFVDDGRSACNDPMTYRTDCGGQKFFRNKFAVCGEFPGDGQSPRDCQCGANQNSHLKLANTFGPGVSLIAAPSVAITTPAASSTAANTLPPNVIASTGSKRGVNRVELYLNGYKWLSVNGAPFGSNGQANPSASAMLVPTTIPDSIYDIEVRAYDDLELVGLSPIVTVTKGAAGGCATAATCLEGQKCESGRCFWDPPAGQQGDDCTFPQFCESGICAGASETSQICTTNCIPGVADSCEAGFTCAGTGNAGFCLFAEDGGCCSTSSGVPWTPFTLGAVVIGFVAIRRRRS